MAYLWQSCGTQKNVPQVSVLGISENKLPLYSFISLGANKEYKNVSLLQLLSSAWKSLSISLKRKEDASLSQ